MKCAQAQKLIKPFLDHSLPDHEMSQFLEHVASCQDCYDELGIYLAINETLKNDNDRNEPENYNFRDRLKKEIGQAEAELRMRRSRVWITGGLTVVTVMIMGLLIYTGIRQMEHPALPTWETEQLSEETADTEEMPGQSVAETAGQNTGETDGQNTGETDGQNTGETDGQYSAETGDKQENG